jgi:hypothetical protein
MKAPGIHCYIAGSIPAVTPRYCTKKIEKCSLEHKKNKGKKLLAIQGVERNLPKTSGEHITNKHQTYSE